MQRGLEAFERNTGVAHPSASKLKRPIERGNGNPLTDYGDTLWGGPITVGTPAVTYICGSSFLLLWPKLIEWRTVQFDTGSSDLFLPASNCGSTCDGHTLYYPSASSTSSDVGQTFEIQYADGAVSGEQYTDDVTLAGYMVGTWYVFFDN
jgi:hypothetical protein